MEGYLKGAQMPAESRCVIERNDAFAEVLQVGTPPAKHILLILVSLISGLLDGDLVLDREAPRDRMSP